MLGRSHGLVLLLRGRLWRAVLSHDFSGMDGSVGRSRYLERCHMVLLVEVDAVVFLRSLGQHGLLVEAVEGAILGTWICRFRVLVGARGHRLVRVLLRVEGGRRFGMRDVRV